MPSPEPKQFPNSSKSCPIEGLFRGAKAEAKFMRTLNALAPLPTHSHSHSHQPIASIIKILIEIQMRDVVAVAYRLSVGVAVVPHTFRMPHSQPAAACPMCPTCPLLLTPHSHLPMPSPGAPFDSPRALASAMRASPGSGQLSSNSTQLNSNMGYGHGPRSNRGRYWPGVWRWMSFIDSARSGETAPSADSKTLITSISLIKLRKCKAI